jgi:hypothetical protein
MNTYTIKNTLGKRLYSKPELKTTKIDNRISMIMMSDSTPVGDPESMNIQHSNTVDHYKIMRG